MNRESRPALAVLSVPDDADDDWVAAVSRQDGLAVESASPNDALRVALEGSYDAVVTAVHFSDAAMTGFDLLDQLAEHAPQLPVALVAAGPAADRSGADARSAVNSGAVAYIDPAEQGDPYGTLAARLRSAATTTLRGTESDGGVVDTSAARARDTADGRQRPDELRLYETIVETIDEAVYVLDDEERFVYVNDRYADLKQASREEIVGTPLTEWVPSSTLDRTRGMFAEITDDERAVGRLEYECRRADGGTFPAELRFTDITFADGTHGRVGVIRDISDSTEQKRQLTAVNHLLRHNLRNRLTVIEGRARQIEEATTGEVAAAAEAICAETDALQTMAEKQQALIELLTDPPPRRPIDLRACLVGAVDSVDDGSASVAVGEIPSVSVEAVPQLRQAIVELLENAVAHDPAPMPEVTVDATASGSMAEITVADAGPPIPEQERAGLDSMDELSQTNHATGVGLRLAACVVDRSGGRFDIEAGASGGNVIRMLLPIAA